MVIQPMTTTARHTKQVITTEATAMHMRIITLLSTRVKAARHNTARIVTVMVVTGILANMPQTTQSTSRSARRFLTSRS